MVKRIAIVGPAVTGKTCLMRRYIKNHFSETYMSSITSETHNDMHGNIVWDTPGDKRWEDETLNVLKRVKGTILCFTPSRPETFERAMAMLNDKPCVIAATMADVEPFAIRPCWSKTAAEHGLKIIKVSSANGDGVYQIFRELLSMVEDDEVSLTSSEYASQQLSSCIYTGLNSYIYDSGNP